MPSGISQHHVAKFLALGITCTHDDKVASERCPRQIAGYFPTDGPAYNADDLYSVGLVFCKSSIRTLCMRTPVWEKIQLDQNRVKY